MNKGLEALENLCNQCEFYQFEKGLRPKKCPFNKNCVHKCRIEQELKAYYKLLQDIFPHPKETGEEYRQLAVKRLLALEIIKEKLVDMCLLENSCTRDEYNKWISQNDLGNCYLEQEEYDFLKEVLL